MEIHGANGYLLDQFTRDGSNQRTDEYGGSTANRLRLPLEVADAVVGVWGAGRVGYRVSPTGAFNTMHDTEPAVTFGLLAKELGDRGLAYLHNAEAFAGGVRDEAVIDAVRGAFNGVYIGNGGYTGESARERIAASQADAVAFGELYIANPDLAERLEAGAALNTPNPDTYYGGDATGYTDYPAMEDSAASA